MKYNVLWFDDECEDLPLIKDDALENGIVLYGVTNAADGIDKLRSRLDFFDAVLLDGIFFEDDSQSGNAIGNQALLEVSKELLRLDERKLLPSFVLSGQTSFVSKDDEVARLFHKNRVYSKLDDEDQKKLWSDIKSECDSVPDVEIKKKHNRVLSVCTEKYIGTAAYDDLFQNLKSLEQSRDGSTTVFTANDVRILLEYMFRGANKRGLLHDALIDKDKGVNLWESYHFMSGNPCHSSKVQCAQAHFPPVIAGMAEDIILFGNIGSHSEDEESQGLSIKKHRSVVGTTYLEQSLLMRLLDVLLWFKSYADENPDIEKNKGLWKNLDDVEVLFQGQLEQDENGNFHCGQFALGYQTVQKMNLSLGTTIKVTGAQGNTNKSTSDKYPQFAYRFTVG